MNPKPKLQNPKPPSPPLHQRNEGEGSRSFWGLLRQRWSALWRSLHSARGEVNPVEDTNLNSPLTPQPEPANPAETSSTEVFEKIEDPSPAPAEEKVPPAKATEPKLIPYTGKEIAGAASVLFAGVLATPVTPASIRIKSAGQFFAFLTGFVSPPEVAIPGAEFQLNMGAPELLDKIGVGEALAAFGFGKREGSEEALESAPPVVKILMGVGVLGLGAIAGVMSARQVAEVEAESSPAGDRSGSASTAAVA